MREFAVDYRKLRPSNITSPQYRHLFLLLFWPMYCLAFNLVERVYKVDKYYPIYSELDDLVPFCEYFLIPYLFWFVFLAGMVLYTLLYDIDSFKKYMYFIMISYSVTIFIYIIFPNCQNLRPTEFANENIFTDIIAHYYQFDTNTNVCPSLHVIGSLAVACAAMHTKGFEKPWIKACFWVVAILISISTVFVKQHSVIDVMAAVPLCLCVYGLVYKYQPSRRKVPSKEGGIAA